MFQNPADHVACWLHYLRIFALQTPFGLPVKITVGVSEYDGLTLAREWNIEPTDVVDGYGRPCKQIETSDRLIAVEWLIPVKEENRASGPSTWGLGMPTRRPRR
jgi:hypothetical protein